MASWPPSVHTSDLAVVLNMLRRIELEVPPGARLKELRVVDVVRKIKRVDGSADPLVCLATFRAMIRSRTAGMRTLTRQDVDDELQQAF